MFRRFSTMGNRGNALGDEPVSKEFGNRNIQHFDHEFPARLHTSHGHVFDSFGECSFADRPVVVRCKGKVIEIIEEVGISTKNVSDFNYAHISSLSWDHSNSEVKFDLRSHGANSHVILVMGNSIEFEGEIKERLYALSLSDRSVKIPSPTYIGMFAGATKPKPFQRKRPNLSRLPPGKLPTLQEMRTIANELHKGSYKPCSHGNSRRMDLALQHIYEGCNIFPIAFIRGHQDFSSKFMQNNCSLVISDEFISFKNRASHQDIKIQFSDISHWCTIDNDAQHLGNSYLEIVLTNGTQVEFGFFFIRDVKHSLEYFWNSYKTSIGKPDEVQLGSTHGRPIVSLQTLSGEKSPPPPPQGQYEVVDQDGTIVRPGGKMLVRKASLATGNLSSSKEPKVVPPENKNVKPHWHKVVAHQGWLLKQGGVGVGSSKSWIRRYFVLYKTSMGHFLVYYSDFTECPLYTTDRNHRNIVDLAKATYIRPGSNKANDNPDGIPPYSFDIVTTEREWTLCAESQDNVKKWLQIITRAVDEDVAVLPDEELIFKVKPKNFPTQFSFPNDYTTTLKVSSNGIVVTVPDTNSKDGSDRQLFFWVYTDFFKWSLIAPDGKLALSLDVFTDSTFSTRYEFLFRTKEAQRLGTAIEFFIEKFMSVMHIRLETMEGAFDNIEPLEAEKDVQNNDESHIGKNDDYNSYQEPVDLLDLGFDSYSQTNTSSSQNTNSNPVEDILSLGAPSNPPTQSVDLFDSDPFSSDPFSSQPAPSASGVAPPLTPQQIKAHNDYFIRILGLNEGVIYNDGSLNIAARLEFRGSQCRLMLNLTNQSASEINNLSLKINDSLSFLRYEISPLAASIAAGQSTTCTVMVECMKPASILPELVVAYGASGVTHDNTIKFPMLATSFNEPLLKSGPEFTALWDSMAQSEVIDIINPTITLDANLVSNYFTKIFKFHSVTDLDDASEFVLYGSTTLRTGFKNQNGEKVSVGVLSKFEVNVESNMMRISVRTVPNSVAPTIFDAIRNVFTL